MYYRWHGGSSQIYTINYYIVLNIYIYIYIYIYTYTYTFLLFYFQQLFVHEEKKSQRKKTMSQLSPCSTWKTVIVLQKIGSFSNIYLNDMKAMAVLLKQ